MRKGILWGLVLCLVLGLSLPAAATKGGALASAMQEELQKEEALRAFARMEAFWRAWGVEDITPFDPEHPVSPAADHGMESVTVVTPLDLAEPGEASWSASYEPMPGLFIQAYTDPDSKHSRPMYVFGVGRKDTLTPEQLDIFTRILPVLEPQMTENASNELMMELIYAGGPISEDKPDQILGVLYYGGWRFTLATDHSSDDGFLYTALPTEPVLEAENTSIARQEAVLNRMAGMVQSLGYPLGDLANWQPNEEDPALLRMERELLPGVILCELYDGPVFSGYSLEIPPEAQEEYDAGELFMGALWALNPFLADEVIEEVYGEMLASMTDQHNGSYLSEPSWIDERAHFLQEHDGCKHLLMFSHFPQ